MKKKIFPCPSFDFTCPYYDANGNCMIDDPLNECDAWAFAEFFEGEEE